MIVAIGSPKGRIAVYLDEQDAHDMAAHYGHRDAFSGELLAAIAKAYPSEPPEMPNPCIHTPSRCNGGGYDGCACGPYK